MLLRKIWFISVALFTNAVFAGGLNSYPPANINTGDGKYETSSISTHVYSSGDMFNGRPTFFYRLKTGGNYEIKGLPVSRTKFNSAADLKINIWQHIQDCDMGDYRFVSPATKDMCTYNVSPTCRVHIKCTTGDSWRCDFISNTPEQLIGVLRQDKAENLGMETITPYEDALYNSPECKIGK